MSFFLLYLSVDIDVPFSLQTISAETSTMAHVPTVLLVVEGGPGTFKTVKTAVTANNPTPVVLAKGEFLCFSQSNFL